MEGIMNFEDFQKNLFLNGEKIKMNRDLLRLKLKILKADLNKS